MDRLVGKDQASDVHGACDKTEVARRLAMRLAELSGGGRPEWSCDASVLDRHAIPIRVDHIDAHLKDAPDLNAMALRVGLSPKRLQVSRPCHHVTCQTPAALLPLRSWHP
jgi:hypothetical protein